MAKENDGPTRIGEGQKQRKRRGDQLAACMRLIAIGELTAGVAHELNNPLSVILGYAQSMMHESTDIASLKTSLKTVEREAQRCKRVVQDLLNFSRFPKPGKVLEDVTQVLDGALSLVETQTRIQNVQLIRDYAKDLPMLYVDRHKIQQLIVNLCLNSLDAMPKGGELRVAVSLFSVQKELSGIQIQVRDTGTGIAPEIRDRIFDPFFTTKPLGKGTGLGLSLVQEIVKDHGGFLEVFSEQNHGTTFSIRLMAGQRPFSIKVDGKDVEGPPVLSA